MPNFVHKVEQRSSSERLHRQGVGDLSIICEEIGAKMQVGCKQIWVRADVVNPLVAPIMGGMALQLIARRYRPTGYLEPSQHPERSVARGSHPDIKPA